MRPRKNITLQDIAQSLGISVVSVSNALSNRKGVSAELREKIINKARVLGYVFPQKTQEPVGDMVPSAIPPGIIPGAVIPGTPFVPNMTGALGNNGLAPLAPMAPSITAPYQPQLMPGVPGAQAVLMTGATALSGTGAVGPTGIPVGGQAAAAVAAGAVAGSDAGLFLPDDAPQQILRLIVLIDELFVKEFPSFYMEIHKHLSDYCGRLNHIIYLNILSHDHSTEDLERLLNNGQDSQYQGVFVIGQIDAATLRALQNDYQLPVVVIDYYQEDCPRFNFVLIDSFAGMHQLTTAILNQGYRKLRFVGSINETMSILDRYLGFCRALDEHNIESTDPIPDRDFTHSFDLKVELPQHPAELPEVFICNCDKTALLVMQELQRRGLNVPDDIGVAGFDNFYAPLPQNQKIFTFDHSPRKLAQAALEHMLNLTRNLPSEHLDYISGEIVPGTTISPHEGADTAEQAQQHSHC